MNKIILYSGSIAWVLLISITLTSCSKKNTSSKTGMAYNNKSNGGFQVAGKVKRGPGPGLISIEGGTFVMGGSLNQDLAYEEHNEASRCSEHGSLKVET